MESGSVLTGNLKGPAAARYVSPEPERKQLVRSLVLVRYSRLYDQRFKLGARTGPSGRLLLDSALWAPDGRATTRPRNGDVAVVMLDVVDDDHHSCPSVELSGQGPTPVQAKPPPPPLPRQQRWNIDVASPGRVAHALPEELHTPRGCPRGFSNRVLAVFACLGSLRRVLRESCSWPRCVELLITVCAHCAP